MLRKATLYLHQIEQWWISLIGSIKTNFPYAFSGFSFPFTLLNKIIWKKKKAMADTRWFERCFLKWIELIAATHSGFFALFLLPLYVHDVSSTFIRMKVRSTTVRLLRLWSDMNKFCSANDRWPTVICRRDQGQCTGFNGYNRDLIRSWLLDTRGIRAWSRVNYEKWKWA